MQNLHIHAVNCSLVTAKVVSLSESSSAETDARPEFLMNRVDMLGLVHLLLESSATLFAFKRAESLMYQSQVAQQSIVERK